MVDIDDSKLELEAEKEKMRAASQLAVFWRRFRKHKLGMLGFGIFIVMIFFAITADLFAPYPWEYEGMLVESGPTPYGLVSTIVGPWDTSIFEFLSPPDTGQISLNGLPAPDPIRAAIVSDAEVPGDLNHGRPIYAACPFNVTPQLTGINFSVILSIDETDSIGLTEGGFMVQVVVNGENVRNWTLVEKDPVEISDYLNQGASNNVRLNIMDISPDPIKVVVNWSPLTYYEGANQRSLEVNDSVFLARYAYGLGSKNLTGWSYLTSSIRTLSDIAELNYGLPPFTDGEVGFHWLGTDQLGHDILTGLMYGARISLAIGFIAQTISVCIGISIGAISGYYSGILDDILMRIVDIVYAIPFFFLAILILSVFQDVIQGVNPEFGAPIVIALLLGILGWTGVARVTRANFLSLRELEFADAARVLGASDARIIFRHLLPNALAPIIVLFTLGMSGVILSEAGLAFLGLGNPQTPSWGRMLQLSQAGMRFAWWPAVLPGICIFFAVLAFNLIGDALRDALDPRLKE
ncbi:MAG: ABC transporter permease [Candidatus Hermodarchaeota archaeon]